MKSSLEFLRRCLLLNLFLAVVELCAQNFSKQYLSGFLWKSCAKARDVFQKLPRPPGFTGERKKESGFDSRSKNGGVKKSH